MLQLQLNIRLNQSSSTFWINQVLSMKSLYQVTFDRSGIISDTQFNQFITDSEGVGVGVGGFQNQFITTLFCSSIHNQKNLIVPQIKNSNSESVSLNQIILLTEYNGSQEIVWSILDHQNGSIWKVINVAVAGL